MDDENTNSDNPDAALVKEICERIHARKSHWRDAYTKMRDCQAFVRKGASKDWNGAVVHAAQRMVRDWVSALYARNPRTVYRRRPRMEYSVWDGMMPSLEQAKMTLALADPNTAAAAQQPVPSPQQIIEAQSLVEDAVTGMSQATIFDKIGTTTTYLYDYFRDEQPRAGRQPMKKMIRRGFVAGVSYVAPDFQRITDMTPTNKRRIGDIRARLDEVGRRARALEDGDMKSDDPQVTEMKQAIALIEAEPEMVIREGLTFRYPSSTAIIPDEGLTDIMTFEGCDEVAEEFVMTKQAAEAQYGIKIDKCTPYNREGMKRSEGKGDYVTIWQNWNIRTGLVHTVCDGFPQFLTEDHSPPVFIEEFWPWLTFAPIPSDDEENPWPISIVETISNDCMEINRTSQLRADTRYAARPGTVGTAMLSGKDASRITNRKANTHVTLESLNPDRPVAESIQPFPTPNIDPNVFDISPEIRNIELSTGQSEARLEPSSRVSATAVSISEAGHSANMDSIRDELDDLQTQLARRCGQILMIEMSEPEVKRIVGTGAMWPEADMKLIKEELFLEVEFGSSGFPNQAQRVATLRDMTPLLMQIRGVVPEKLANMILQAVDQNMSLEDFYDPSLTQSINAMNAQAGATQGGADNAPKPPGPASTEPAITA